MARGNPENLRVAAQRKRQAATQRAETALDALINGGEPITFRGLAKTAGVSIDFLYRSPLRARVEQLRANQQGRPPAPRQPEPDQPPSQSNVVRALTAQLSELKRHHRAELARLETALAAAQGENLELRRRLGRPASRAPSAGQPERDHDAGQLIEPAPPARGAAG
jgi:Family of unknown function (DUF6262)